MKILFNFFAFITFSTICNALETIDYQALIQPYAYTWNQECIINLSTQDIITISHIILFSYQIVQASLIMSKARLTIQAEVLKIVTPAINDAFNINIHTQNNDFTQIKQAIVDLEQAQEQIKTSCNDLKKILPLIITINPATIQLLISNFKSIMLDWAKTQEEIMIHFEQIKEDLNSTANLFIHINSMFQAIITAQSIEHNQLLHSTNSLTNMYKKFENTMTYLTTTRQQGIAELTTLLTFFFKYHYQILYKHIKQYNYNDSHDTLYQKLPNPDQLFITV